MHTIFIKFLHKKMALCLGLNLILGLYACTPPRPAVLNGSDAPPKAEEYLDILGTWTRDSSIYRVFDQKLFISATYHSPEFRRAFAVAFPDIYGHGGAITKRELVDLTGDVENFHNFFMTIFTPEVKWNDLAKNDSIWRITLIADDEVSVEPTEIVPVKVDENLKAVYPHIDHFDKCYLIRFPSTDMMQRLVITPQSERFKIRIASALGSSEMAWQLSLGQKNAPSAKEND
jgi:hypothetical protein